MKAKPAEKKAPEASVPVKIVAIGGMVLAFGSFLILVFLIGKFVVLFSVKSVAAVGSSGIFTREGVLVIAPSRQSDGLEKAYDDGSFRAVVIPQ